MAHHVLTRFIREDRGQDLIEYGLLATLIALTALSAISALGETLGERWSGIASEVASW